jgi:hypothetical protein
MLLTLLLLPMMMMMMMMMMMSLLPFVSRCAQPGLTFALAFDAIAHTHTRNPRSDLTLSCA